ncbi:hypothetical protein IKE_05778 [Bacillus cereus VD196]|uniref:Yip1 domain-containing protein n=1 Tax=Bacillus cereus VD196 TaxID=1053243 RepID=A0A9W5PYP0_BACCE|nr:YIP1 family protein [Bacillus cereus]EOO61988.1 hypothetical protein IKE_05778 [Bacillus cereus VD196]
MIKFIGFFINPLNFMRSLDKKPEILFPLLLSIVTPLLSINPVLNQFGIEDTKWVILIAFLVSLFSLMTFFITSFVIYLLLSLVLLEKEMSFKKVLSIYGYTQCPKFFLAVLISIFPKLSSILINNANNFYEAALYFFTSPLNIWRYILLAGGFYVLTKVKMQRVIILAIFFAVLEVYLHYYVPSAIKDFS